MKEISRFYELRVILWNSMHKWTLIGDQVHKSFRFYDLFVSKWIEKLPDGGWLWVGLHFKCFQIKQMVIWFTDDGWLLCQFCLLQQYYLSLFMNLLRGTVRFLGNTWLKHVRYSNAFFSQFTITRTIGFSLTI